MLVKQLNEITAKLNDSASIILPAFQYLSGASENICRLCFGVSVSDGGVYLNESCYIQGWDDDVGTFEAMLRDLEVVMDTGLPNILCEYCADSARYLWLFQKLCQLSTKRWQEAIEKFTNILDQKKNFTSSVRTTFFILNNDSNIILTTKTVQKEKNNKKVLEKIQQLIKAREKRALKKRSSLKCKECGVKLKTRYCLNEHKKSHLGHDKYQCPQCPFIVASRGSLTQHFDRKHRPKNIPCPKCDKMFTTETLLKYHDAQYHRPAECKQCGIDFPSKKELEQHMFKHQNTKCPYCGKKLANVTSFKQHLIRCNKEVDRSKFICDICNKTYNTKVGVQSHLVAAHGLGPIVYCDWCKKPFSSVSKMKEHAVKHTKERKFNCDQCGGWFVTLAGLKNHLRLHTGERPYPCDLCSESFPSASRRMEHKRRKHIGPQKECTVCHSKFLTHYGLMKHMALHSNPRSKYFTGDSESENRTLNRKQTICSK